MTTSLWLLMIVSTSQFEAIPDRKKLRGGISGKGG
jgi:hypothetical protein